MAKEKIKEKKMNLWWKVAKAIGIGTIFAFVSSLFLTEDLVSVSLALGLLVVYLEIRKQ